MTTRRPRTTTRSNSRGGSAKRLHVTSKERDTITAGVTVRRDPVITGRVTVHQEDTAIFPDVATTPAVSCNVLTHASNAKDAPPPKNVVAETTANMLLEIQNMTDREIGLTYRDVRVEEQVKQYCKKTLFHKLKFIINSTDLGRLKHPHDIGNYVMRGLNVTDNSIKAKWWLLYQNVVKKSIDTQRSNCNMAVKSVVISKFGAQLCLYFVDQQS